MMLGRTWSAGSSHRYGFNGKEQDTETYGDGNFYDYGFRIYNPQVSKFLSVDPLTQDYPFLSPYNYAENDPVRSIDMDGLERLCATDINYNQRTATITVVKDIYIIRQQNTPQRFIDIDAAQVRNNFLRGNTTVYLKELPQNGQKLATTNGVLDRRKWKKGNAWKINVVYDVNVIVPPNNAGLPNTDQDRGLSTIVSTNKSNFQDGTTVKGYDTYAQSSTRNQMTSVETGICFGVETVLLNPGAKTGTLSAADIITHEVGIHNMAGVEHELNELGEPLYSDYGLESNVSDKVYPTYNETIKILNKNLSRGNLDTE